MKHDPADETDRKPRQLRNTPLLKYVRLASLVTTLIYAGAMYIGYRRNILPYLNDEKYKINQISEDNREMIEDYISNPLLRGVIDKYIEKRKDKSKEADLKDKQILDNA